MKRRGRRWAMMRYALLLLVMLSLDSFAIDAADPPISTGPNFDEQGGEALYRGVCQGCHMASGQGASSGAGAYPALRGNQRLVAAAYPIYILLHGRNGMPPVGTMMSDAQVADVINYVRSHFDNHYTDVVTPDDVSKLR